MAINHIDVPRPPRDVFAVLADPDSYEDWVVGASQIRDVDGPWPAPGSRFHHKQGLGPIGLKDTTSVLECDKDKRLSLEVRARPALVARVDFDLQPNGAGTHVTMTEVPIRGWMKLLPRKLVDWSIHMRNRETLRRLSKIAEASGASASPDSSTI